MLKDFWEENKRFLLLVGGGLLVFLIADHYIGNYIGGTENIRKKSQKRRQDVVLLHKGLKNGWYEEKRKVQACKDHEAGLKDKLCLPEPAALDGENSQLQIKFDKAISDTWEGVRQEANRAGIRLPAPLTARDFNVEQDDTVAQYQEHYSDLAIVERALEVLVKSGVSEIETPEPYEPDRLPVKDNDSVKCLYRAVSIGVTTSFESLQKVFEQVQSGEPFLQVRLRSLGAKGSTNEEERALEGEIEFIGFRLEEGAAAEESAGPGRRSTGRNRRRRRP